MGALNQIKFLAKTIEELMAELNKNHFSSQEVLSGVLMELYDANRVSGSQNFQQTHEKVWEVIEAIRQREDGQSKIAYETYLKVYRGICQELGLSEVPVYNAESQTTPESTRFSENLLARTINSLIVDIEKGNLEPQHFLRQGLEELTDRLSQTPFLKTEFLEASQLYANVMDFLGSSGVYRDVEGYRRQYKILLASVNGNSKKSAINSAGIGRRAFSPTKAIYGPKRPSN